MVLEIILTQVINHQWSNDNGTNNNNGNGNGNGNSNNNVMKSFKSFLEDVRKMPDGNYGVYADKFKNKKSVDNTLKN